MNLKVYRKTRYQNIYQHIKNKNYVIMISKPVKTSISTINGEKIWKIEDAVKIRDNAKIKTQKKNEIMYKENLDPLWEKYIVWCETIDKQDYNTIKNKKKVYNKHIKNKFNKKISKFTKEEIVSLINESETTDKQKNNILKLLKTFFKWCTRQEILIINPCENIRKIKVAKPDMKYWIPEEFTKFMNYINNVIENTSNLATKEIAYRTKTLVLIGFSLGDRIGETRALKWDDINKEQQTISINHSINYDTKDESFVKTTKTYNSQRVIDITEKLIQEIYKYKTFLQNEMQYDLDKETLIFYNFKTHKPYSDTSLRKYFYKYSDEANCPRIRMYDLRHTYAATMMSEGKEVYTFSQRMGHKSIKTTIDEYGHISKKLRKEIAEITDKFI